MRQRFRLFGLHQASDLAQRLAALDANARLRLLLARAPARFIPALLRQRYLALAVALNLPALNDEMFNSLAAPELRGPLRIGTPHDGSQFILPNLLTRFTQLYPKVQIEMHPDRSPYLLQALKRGDIKITVAATAGGTPDPAHPRIRLRSSPIAWLCAVDYAFNRSEPVPLVLPDEPSGYRRGRHVARLRGLARGGLCGARHNASGDRDADAGAARTRCRRGLAAVARHDLFICTCATNTQACPRESCLNLLAAPFRQP